MFLIAIGRVLMVLILALTLIFDDEIHAVCHDHIIIDQPMLLKNASGMVEASMHCRI
jgi:hypothetical protein